MMTSHMQSIRNRAVKKDLIFATILLLFFILFSLSFLTSTNRGRDVFQEMAHSFMQGRLDVPTLIAGVGDVVDYQGKHYIPFGPFPAIIYMVFGDLSPAVVMVALMVSILFLLYYISRKIGFDTVDSIWAIIAFSFASPLAQIFYRPSNAFISHAIVVACLLASYAVYTRKKNPWLIGILFAIILATRGTAVVCLLFFLIDVIRVNWKNDKKLMFVRLAEMVLPIVITFCVLLWYNYARFGSMLESGYALANINGDLGAMRAMGLFSLIHIPGNLYYFLFAAPVLLTRGTTKVAEFPYIMSSAWGVGLIFSAPYFFSLLWKRFRDAINVELWITVLIAAVPVVSYYGIGFIQTSYRYSLDFLPLLFVIFLRTLYATERNIPRRYKTLFFVVALLNAYLFLISDPGQFLNH